MKQNLIELVFILDRSGSMHGLEADTIGGFNAMLQKQKSLEGEVLVSTVLFSDGYDLLHDRLPIAQVNELTEREYAVGGCTALLDAIGRTIDAIGREQRQAMPEDRPAKTIFVITTDGMENASRECSRAQVKTMVRLRQEEFDWEFLFLGANMDAIAAAGEIGINATHAARFVSDSVGTHNNYSAVSHAIETLRSATPLQADWKASIEQDYQKRSKPDVRSNDCPC